jgi:hypothetical protein
MINKNKKNITENTEPNLDAFIKMKNNFESQLPNHQSLDNALNPLLNQALVLIPQQSA